MLFPFLVKKSVQTLKILNIYLIVPFVGEKIWKDQHIAVGILMNCHFNSMSLWILDERQVRWKLCYSSLRKRSLGGFPRIFGRRLTLVWFVQYWSVWVTPFLLDIRYLMVYYSTYASLHVVFFKKFCCLFYWTLRIFILCVCLCAYNELHII